MIEIERDEYEELPEVIRRNYPRENWQWLPHELKNKLVQLETEPECE